MRANAQQGPVIRSRTRFNHPIRKSSPIPSHAQLLGIDIGGTKLALAVGDSSGRIFAHRRRPTEASGDAEADLRRIAADARSLLDEAGVSLDDVACIGVSVPGPFDRKRGLLLEPPNLPGWNQAPVRRVLADALGRPVHLENDANAAALAEWRFGAGRGFQHLVYLTMSTGIGGGLILDGRLYRGRADGAGEVGHIPVEWDGEPCACGMRGCLEAYAGGAAWARRLRAIAPVDGRVAALAGGREHATPEHLVAAAREGDAFALGELARFNRYLARGIATLIFSLAPEVVILGTIPTAAGDALCLDPVRELVAARVWPLLGEGVEIRPAGLGAELGDYAGLSVALEGLGEI
jgi:glucokinase